ncbi:MAG: hypothetical protein AB7F50_03100 [Fimbriimonadaceae bacterium]
MPGTKCDGVGLTSLEGLTSHRGTRFVGTDARLYRSTVRRSPESVAKTLVACAGRSGYARTLYGSYFNAGERLFEAEVHPLGAREGTFAQVTLCWTEKGSSRAVAREQF